jgi:hypothetical protein
MAVATQSQRNGGGGEASAVMVPFTSASHEHTERAFDITVTPGENAQELGPFDVPAYGYYRHLLLQVETVEDGELETGGAADPDFPFNIFSNVQIADVNGANIFGPLDGYGAAWASILGGYAGRPDPRVMPYYSKDPVKPQLLLRVPQEISHRDGFGSLANQSTAANYKIFLTLRQASQLVNDKGYKKVPKLRIRGWVETWSLPNATDVLGRPQAEAPPMLDSSQFHSQFLKDTQAGANTVLMTRVGSLIRQLIIIARNEDGVRSDEVFPDPATLEWDSRDMRTDTQMMLIEHLAASVPELSVRDNGVFAYLFNRSTKMTVGDDAPTFWYPTVQATRLEIEGTTAKAGTWQIITNDVAPVSVSAVERYTERGRTGFHPEAVGAGQVGGKA